MRRNEGVGSGTFVVRYHREPCAHTHSAGQIARGAPAPQGSCPAQECGAGRLGVPRGGAPGTRGCRGCSL